MRFKSNLIRKYRFMIIAFIITTITVIAIIMIHELNRVTLERAEEYVKLNTSELATLASSYFSRDIELSARIAENPKFSAWLMDEQNQELKREALDELSKYNHAFLGQNSFIAFSSSDQIYYINSNGITEDVYAEAWFHQAKTSDLPYTINLGFKNSSETEMLWINAKVYHNETLIGIVGTGIKLEELTNDDSHLYTSTISTTLYINHLGEIQHVLPAQEELLDTNILSYAPLKPYKTELEAYLRTPSEDFTLRLRSQVFAYAGISPVEGTNWHALSLVKLDDFYDLDRYVLIFSLIVLTIIILTAAIAISIQRLFIKPFDKLVESLDESRTPYTVDIFGLDRNDEFGILADSIRRLSNRLVSSVPAGLFLLDKNGKFIYGNMYFLKQFGVESIEEFYIVYGNTLATLFNDASDYSKLNQSIEEALEINFIESQMIDSSKKVFWAEIHLIRHEDIKEISFEGILLNIQLKKEYEKELINLASVDPLTNLYNRRHFEETVKQEILRTKRYDHKLSMILFDLDHFKQINDQFGHIVGDEILHVITSIASECIRSTDTLARWGGEEFSILLPETPIQGAFQVAEKIRLQIAEYTHPMVPKISASFGISEFQMTESYIEWFERVDRNLYLAKDNGRNQVYGLSKDFDSIDHLIKLNWHNSFRSGNTIIDDQHKELFNIANAIISNSMKIASENAQRHAVEAFYEYVKKHFEDEVYILKEVGYPEDQLEAHIASHNKLLVSIQSKISKSDLTSEEVLKIGMMLIQEVVYEHMIQEDSKYFKYTNPK